MAKYTDAARADKIKDMQSNLKKDVARAATIQSRSDQKTGRLEEKQAELAKLLAEIRKAKLEPRDLAKAVDDAIEECALLADSFARDLDAVEQQFLEMESKK